MSQQTVIDSMAFARERRAVDGVFKLSDMVRLASSLASTDGEVRYSLQGEEDRHGAWLRLKAEATPVLECQRCLSGMPYPLRISTRLRLVPEGVELSQEDLEDDGIDYIDADREFDVAALVEDELILAMPLAPMHEESCVAKPAGPDGKVSPFAALAALRGRAP